MGLPRLFTARRSSFLKQLIFTFALGIFCLSLLSSLAISTFSHQIVRERWVAQGMRTTENLAEQSTLALLYLSAENAEAPVHSILAFPDVRGVAIYRPDHTELLGLGGPIRSISAWPEELQLEQDLEDVWQFVAPVIAHRGQQNADSPFDPGGRQRELLGYVRLVMGKDALKTMELGILRTNLAISGGFTLVFLLVLMLITRRLTTPIKALAEIMGRASAGEKHLRATIGGPRDIVDMERAFNTMMNALENREQELESARQELERRVVERTAQLQAANQELEAFAYSVSHDLRAPLRHIDGFLGLLKKRIGETLDDEGRRYIATVSGAALRMAALIDDLLSFSRMGRVEMAKTQVDLAGLVREVIGELQPDTSGRTIDWRIGALPEVSGDRAMLQIALVNLIANSIKFTHPHPSARIEIGSLNSLGTEHIIFVRDNGVGFDMQYAHKLFGVFQRLHGADEFEGTGIGLANVRRVVERHGGRTWAEGQIDAGATFFFSLPR